MFTLKSFRRLLKNGLSLWDDVVEVAEHNNMAACVSAPTTVKITLCKRGNRDEEIPQSSTHMFSLWFS
jgi:hypothetical protein